MADNTCAEGWVITLVKIRPACRMARWYRVEVRATLFVPCGVVCTWGSLVTRYARFRVLPCETWESAVQLAQSIAQRKLRKGYTLAQLS